MLLYEFKLAFKSLRKNPILSSLMIGAIALGIGVCMITVTMFYLMSGDPIPHKSDRLFAVQIDSWSKERAYSGSTNEMPFQLTWPDSVALMNRAPDFPQTAMFKSSMIIEQLQQGSELRREIVRMTGRDFFSMFDLEFIYGTAWTPEMEQQAQQVVVLSETVNNELFNGQDSVGDSIRVDDREYRVVGVVKDWSPVPNFYDLNNGSIEDPEAMYLPISLSEPLAITTAGNTNCWKPSTGSGPQAVYQSECVWTQYWVELNDANEVAEYRNFLEGYFAEQQQLGRFERPQKVAVSNVREWLNINQVVENDNRVLVGLAFMFLSVCVFNTVGLMLTKFLGRSKETSIRRALGATRMTILRQHLVEVSSIGFVGGILGLLLTWAGLSAIKFATDIPEQLLHLDLQLMALALILALVATLAAGLYPSWHIGRISPARYLRT